MRGGGTEASRESGGPGPLSLFASLWQSGERQRRIGLGDRMPSAVTRLHMANRKKSPRRIGVSDANRKKSPRRIGVSDLASEKLGSQVLVFNDDEVIELLRAAIEREGNQGAFAMRHGLERTSVNQILNRKKPVSGAVVKALGLRKVYASE